MECLAYGYFICFWEVMVEKHPLSFIYKSVADIWGIYDSRSQNFNYIPTLRLYLFSANCYILVVSFLRINYSWLIAAYHQLTWLMEELHQSLFQYSSSIFIHLHWRNGEQGWWRYHWNKAIWNLGTGELMIWLKCLSPIVPLF